MAFIVRLLRGAAAAHGVKVHVGFTSAFGGMSLVEYTDQCIWRHEPGGIHRLVRPRDL
jgi:hypothetical protein